jgi:hypothetical protein
LSASPRLASLSTSASRSADNGRVDIVHSPSDALMDAAPPSDQTEVWEEYREEEFLAAASLQEHTAEELRARSESNAVLNSNVARTQEEVQKFNQRVSFQPGSGLPRRPSFETRFDDRSRSLAARVGKSARAADAVPLPLAAAVGKCTGGSLPFVPPPRAADAGPQPLAAAVASGRPPVIEVDVLMHYDPSVVAAVGAPGPLHFTGQSLIALARDMETRGGGGPSGGGRPGRYSRGRTSLCGLCQRGLAGTSPARRPRRTPAPRPDRRRARASRSGPTCRRLASRRARPPEHARARS